MVNAQGHPAPDYPEYQALLEEARRRSRGPINPRDIRYGGRYDQVALRRGYDWCLSVLGHFPGILSISHTECELLVVADERNIDPPLPARIAAARGAADKHRADRAAARAAAVEVDQATWAAVRTQARVPLQVFLNPTARVRNGFDQYLGHAVPDVDCYSARGRRHLAGRALCESEQRGKPLRLKERPSPDAPVTCVRCLSWATKVRTTP